MSKQVYATLAKAKEVVANRDSISQDDASQLLDEITDLLGTEKGTPWWVIALKVLAYAIGLILAGFGTTAAAATVHLI